MTDAEIDALVERLTQKWGMRDQLCDEAAAAIAQLRVANKEILDHDRKAEIDAIDRAERAEAEVAHPTCPSCRNKFMQPFECMTCGAQRLYDYTLQQERQRAERAEAEVTRLRLEVSNRNIRAIEGDKHKAAFDAEYNRAERAEFRIADLERERDAMLAVIRAADAVEFYGMGLDTRERYRAARAQLEAKP